MTVTQLLTKEFETRQAINFYDRFGSNANEAYFVFISKPDVWPKTESETDGTETTEGVPTPLNVLSEKIDAMSSCIFAKQVFRKNASLVVPRINWKYGEVYDIHNEEIDLDGKQFYILTDDFNVYKCISNNDNSPSVVKPTGTTTEEQITSDGYIWKFVYKIREELYSFLTNSGGHFNQGWMPIEILPSIVPSFDARILQLDVETDAVHGTIDEILVTDAGKSYTDAIVQETSDSDADSSELANTDATESMTTFEETHIVQENVSAGETTLLLNVDAGAKSIMDYYNDNFVVYIKTGAGLGQVRIITDYFTDGTVVISEAWTKDIPAGSKYEILPRVEIVGNGTDAIVIASINTESKVIEGFNILDSGKDYTKAEIQIYRKLTADAEHNSTKADVLISPLGGHGKYPVWEFGASNLMVTGEFDNESETPSGRTIPSTKYHKIGLVSNLRGNDYLTNESDEDLLGVDAGQQTIELTLENEYKTQTIWFNECAYLEQDTDGLVARLNKSDFIIGDIVKQGPDGAVNQARGIVRSWELVDVVGPPEGEETVDCGCVELPTAPDKNTLGKLVVDILQYEFKGCGSTIFKIVREDYPTYADSTDGTDILTDSTDNLISKEDETFPHVITSIKTFGRYNNDTFIDGYYVLGDTSKQVGKVSSWFSDDAGNTGRLVIDNQSMSTISTVGWIEPSFDQLGSVVEGEHVFFFKGIDDTTGNLDTGYITGGGEVNSGRITKVKTIQDATDDELNLSGSHFIDVSISVSEFDNVTNKYTTGESVEQVDLTAPAYKSTEVVASGIVADFRIDETDTTKGVLEVVDVSGEFLLNTTDTEYAIITDENGDFPFTLKITRHVIAEDVKYPDFNKKYGMNVLYIQNVEGIQRADNQTDTFRLVIEF